MKRYFWITGIIILAAVSCALIWQFRDSGQVILSTPSESIKVGVITPLTGDSAYWGMSTQRGIQLAEKELREEGIPITFLFEDGKLDGNTALQAAHKLVELDQVQAIYSEFAPAANALATFLQSSSILHIYDAAIVSPLQNKRLIYKSYIDYRAGCRRAADYLRSQGVKKLGVLKMQFEFGDLCVEGLRDVYGDQVIVEGYAPANVDFRTSLVKLIRQDRVDAVVNAAFSQEMMTSIKQLRELGGTQTFVGVLDAVPDVRTEEQRALLEGAIFFGLPDMADELSERAKRQFPDQSMGDAAAFGLGYLHAKQIGRALMKCSGDKACLDKTIAEATPDPLIGFQGFEERIATFSIQLKKFERDQFVSL